MSQTHQVSPIGYLRTPYRAKEDTPIQGAFRPQSTGTIEILAPYVDGLDDIEGFSHLIVIHLLDRGGDIRLRVLPLLDDETHGVFATRFPARPNRIGLTVVPLVRRDGATLHIKNVDMLDGTPVLDIKPYVPRFDAYPDATEGWFADRPERPKPAGRE